MQILWWKTTGTWINSGSRRRRSWTGRSVGGVPSAKVAPKKSSRYGQSRRLRRRGLVLLVVLALVLLGLPLVLAAPDLARRFTHPLEYEETIRDAATEHDVEPALVAAVIRTESGFDPEVESSQGAYGAMQIQPA